MATMKLKYDSRNPVAINAHDSGSVSPECRVAGVE